MKGNRTPGRAGSPENKQEEVGGYLVVLESKGMQRLISRHTAEARQRDTGANRKLTSQSWDYLSKKVNDAHSVSVELRVHDKDRDK